jgi:hypothetical protein
VRRRLSSLARSDAGASALEIVIVTLVLSVAVIALMSSLVNATRAASYSQERNENLDDLRVMTAVFSKDVRQGVEASVASQSEFTFDTYIDGDLHEVSWRASTVGGADRLVRSVDGVTTSTYVVDLTTTAVFSYFEEVNPADVSRVRIALATQPDQRFAAVDVATEVEMRNVG